MRYNFNEAVDRTEMIGSRWQAMHELKADIPKGVVPFSSADMDFELAPEIREGLKKTLDERVYAYTEPNNYFFESVTDWMSRKHQWQVKKEWIVPVPGVVAGLSSFIHAFTQPGDGVIIMDPVWFMFEEIPKRYHRYVVHNSLIQEDGYYQIDFDQLEALASQEQNTALLLNNPHNPVGRVWTRNELERLAEICQEHDLIIFSDDIHMDIVHKGFHHLKFSEISDYAKNNIVVATSPTKSFNLSGMCIANIIIPNDAKRKVFLEQSHYLNLNKVNAMALDACAIAYNEAEAWLDELLDLLERNSGFLKEFLNEELPEALVYPLEGTYLQWINLNPYGLDYGEIERINIEQNVFLTEGYAFGANGEGFNRINIATPSNDLKDGLERYVPGIKRLIKEEGH